MHGGLSAGIRLIHVEETAQVHAFGAQKADVQRGIFCRLQLKTKAGLDSVRRFVVFIKARDHGVAKEAAASHCAARAKAQWSGIRVSSAEHACQRNLSDVGSAGKSKEACCRIQSILIGATGECSCCAAAGRRLAGEQWHGDNSMKN